MLNNISWGLFFTAASVLLIAYYLFVGLAYYPKELLSLFAGKKNVPLPATAQSSSESVFSDIMGAAMQPPSDYTRYLPAEENNESDFIDEDYQMPVTSPVPLPADIAMVEGAAELAESIQIIIQVIAEGEGDKEDVQNLFTSTLQKYPGIAASQYRYLINDYIADNCKAAFNFPVTTAEINALWDR